MYVCVHCVANGINELNATVMHLVVITGLIIHMLTPINTCLIDPVGDGGLLTDRQIILDWGPNHLDPIQFNVTCLIRCIVMSCWSQSCSFVGHKIQNNVYYYYYYYMCMTIILCGSHQAGLFIIVLFTQHDYSPAFHGDKISLFSCTINCN